MYFLDTSAILESLYGSEKGKKIKNLIYDNPLSISTITAYEILFGLKENEKKLIEQFFKEVTIVDYDLASVFKSVEIGKNLRDQGKMINVMDILVAGSCLLRNFTMVTCDKDFTKIKNLKVKFIN